MFYLLMSRLRETRVMKEEELMVKLQTSKRLFVDFQDYVVAPTVNFWNSSVLPNVYKEFEKFVSRFRVNVLKIEGWLLKLTNYIRGKRNVQNNGCSSDYWKDMNSFKNGINNNGNGMVTESRNERHLSSTAEQRFCKP